MRLRLLIALTLLSAALAATGSALATSGNTEHITVSPTTGKYGTKYAIHVTGNATARGAALALAMTKAAKSACPASYIKGFHSLYALTSAKGKTIAPAYVHGTLEETIHATMKVFKAGMYGICGYLNVGNKTLTRASAHFTVKS